MIAVMAGTTQLEAAETQGIELPASSDFESRTGKGVTGTVEGRKVALGNAALMDELGINPGPSKSKLTRTAAKVRA